ncbi:MAG: MMPL family transporter [Candidatus Brocadiaceae bacterium]|nr:MMPL family transporter [Candidatus Brocadiaceae bacterium]
MAILACIILITVFFGYYARGMRTDNSIEIWLSKNDEDMNSYRAFLTDFGNEEFLIIALSAVNLFKKDSLREIHELAEKLKKLKGVVEVTSLADVFKNKITSPFFMEKTRTHRGRSFMNVFKKEILDDPTCQNTIISQNGRTTAIIASVQCAGPESRKQLVSETRNAVDEMQAKQEYKGHRYHLAGPSVVNAELDRLSNKDMNRLTPIMFVLSIVVLGCLFRTVSGVVIPILSVGVCIVWISGFFVMFGQTMNMVSNMLIPLTFIIALSTSIRLTNHYYREYLCCNDSETAIYNTLRHVGVPILMASITTAIGFASLTTSTIPPVFTTGVFMSGCALLAFFISLTLVPILLSFIPCQKNSHIESPLQCSETGAVLSQKELFFKRRYRVFTAFLTWLGNFTAKNKKYILLCGLGVGGIFLFGISKLQIESDLMASFPGKSKIARDSNYIEKHLMGLLPVEVVAEATDSINMLQPASLNNLVCFQDYLRAIPEVTGTLSIADYIQRTHQIVKGDKPQYYRIPGTEKEASDYLKLASLYGSDSVKQLYTKDQRKARVSIRMKQVGSNRYQAIIKSIKEFIHEHLETTALSWRITGIVPLLINVQDNILRSEIQSFSLAFFFTFVSTAIVLKSIKVGLISIIPNLIPITITLGVMGFQGIRLDAATIMIASIAVGISVDDTIHFFYRFKKELSVDGDYPVAISRTLQRVGKTAVFTSLSAIFGFLVFCFSGFKPIQYFGLLTSITMFNALVADLLISPSCLMLFKPIPVSPSSLRLKFNEIQ